MSAPEPFISVITATFNCDSSVLRTLESVAAQGRADLEHIIVDGGSTDGTMELVRTFASREGSLVRFVSEPDRGVYDAFNKGLRLARGKLEAFLGAGDCYEDGAMEAVAAAFSRDPTADVYYGIVDMIDARGRHDRYAYGPEYLEEGRMMHHAAAFVRGEAYSRIGGFDASYRSAGDLDAFMKLYEGGARFAFVPAVLTRFHAGGISTSSAAAYEERMEIMRRHGRMGDAAYARYRAGRLLRRARKAAGRLLGGGRP